MAPSVGEDAPPVDGHSNEVEEIVNPRDLPNETEARREVAASDVTKTTTEETGDLQQTSQDSVRVDSDDPETEEHTSSSVNVKTNYHRPQFKAMKRQSSVRDKITQRDTHRSSSRGGRLPGLKGKEETLMITVSGEKGTPDSFDGQVATLREILLRKTKSERIPITPTGVIDWGKIHYDVKNELERLTKISGRLDAFITTEMVDSVPLEDIFGKPRK